MRSRPIIFDAESIKAILAGHKTQTRRVIKNPEKYSNLRNCAWFCPYGLVRNHLWVRETWAPNYFENGEPAYKADWKNTDLANQPKWHSPIYMPRSASRIQLEITSVNVERLQEISFEDMKAEGVLSEYDRVMNRYGECPPEDWKATALIKWIKRWNSIHGLGSYQWGSNPWVWTIEFKRVETP